MFVNPERIKLNYAAHTLSYFLENVSSQLVSYLLPNNVLSPHQLVHAGMIIACIAPEDAVLDAVHQKPKRMNNMYLTRLRELSLQSRINTA